VAVGAVSMVVVAIVAIVAIVANVLWWRAVVGMVGMVRRPMAAMVVGRPGAALWI